jgi:hypothetical protein
MPPPPELIGTYTPPLLKVGDRVYCKYRRTWCKVTSWTDAPISWPRVQPLKTRGGSGLLVGPTLLRAMKTESADALKYWFGVSTKVVWRWRKAFGVTQFGTPGSKAAHEAASEQGAAAVRGKRVTRARREQLREHLATVRKKVRRGRWDETGWTKEQLARVGTDHDEAIAKKIGRTRGALTTKRTRLTIPAFSGWVTSGPEWTEEHLSLLGTADDDVVAKKVGRTPEAVRQKRVELKIPLFRDRRRKGRS